MYLSSPPDADVTFTLSSDTPLEGNPDVTSVVFTTTNWNSPKTITVTGADDGVTDGTVNYKITFGNGSCGGGCNYDNASVPDVFLQNLDND